MVDVGDLRPDGQIELRPRGLTEVEADDQVDVGRRRGPLVAVGGREELDAVGDHIGAVPRDPLPHPLERQTERDR